MIKWYLGCKGYKALNQHVFKVKIIKKKQFGNQVKLHNKVFK